MKISKKCEYALMAMSYLAIHSKEGPVLIQDIADQGKMPKKFLEQILLELKKSGLLNSKRGAGGGYTLAKKADKISLAQIIRIIDGPIAPLACVSKMAYQSCPDEKNCGLRHVILDVRNKISDFLEEKKLADICQHEKRWPEGSMPPRKPRKRSGRKPLTPPGKKIIA